MSQPATDEQLANCTVRPKEAADELLRRREARQNLLAFVRYVMPSFQPARHHKLICDGLESVEAGRIDRLMIYAPPRHTKSELGSRKFPGWYLGRNPSHQLITSTYAADFASDFGRDVRNLIREPEYRALFNTKLSEDSQSANRWHTSAGGIYVATGVGGPITGRGANLAILDDFCKNREDADSETMREKTWHWYTSTLYTRLMPNGKIVLICCMTGDTPVLMADGTEKPLCDIRKGDHVATYNGHRITESTVLNWASQGYDSVYKINMTCGKAVRANERHPFLVARNGVLSWIRVRDLKIGDEIVRADGPRATGVDAQYAAIPDVKDLPMREGDASVMMRASLGQIPSDIMVNGMASPAPLMTARVLPEAKVFAYPITTNGDGQPASARHQLLIQGHTKREKLNISTAYLSRIMMPCWRGKKMPAPSAGGALGRVLRHIGGFFMSITTMILDAFGAFSATNATLSLGVHAISTHSSALSDIFSVTTGRIESIRPCGRDEVFDLQVEGTENFIANGLISHNTRWHEDDLAGRLLEAQSKGGDQWTVINLQALTTSQDGQEKALWPEWYPVDSLHRIRGAIGPRDWSALYQQNPQPDEGSYFQKPWFRRFRMGAQPERLNIFMTSDYAVTADGGDYTEHAVWGVDYNGNLWALDWWSGQTTSDVWIDELLRLIKAHKPLAYFGESGVIRRAIEPMLTRRMHELATYCRVEWIVSSADKPSRARGFQSRSAMGKVFVPEIDWGDRLIDQLIRFPTGKYDDAVDACSLMGNVLDQAHPAAIPVSEPKPVVRDWKTHLVEPENNWRVA